MTSPEFDDFVDRAMSSLSDEELKQADSIADIEMALDAKFFKGGKGDQLTRYQDMPVKSLVASDIMQRIGGMRESGELPEVAGYDREGFAGTLRSMFAPMRNFIRNLPIFTSLRSALGRSILKDKTRREKAQRSVLIRRSTGKLSLRRMFKPLSPRVSLRRNIGKIVLGKTKKKMTKKKE